MLAKQLGIGPGVISTATAPSVRRILPEPIDSRVTLRAVPARKLAVIGYSGTWSQTNYEENLKKLQDALKQEGLNWHGEPMWARYDPPWKPWFLRRNEISLELN